ncbi:molybdenum cofactor biosynthesis protein MoaE [Chryseobacterium daecheongense]|uniref:Molybdopterin synthase catalytic subunit n=1 Tax=Chryseobacterium daecheongense TaxID=192389 RepID=A0A3N0VYR5_9FLAO|nr:molybdenum cofactor biosynthesis protein MoaE [Chryseobacterium daecheongense]ROH97877.1 molybdenum cofactor biosynthesis protein MoaE [Chryseobacterium daecheongense]TDX92947.1 molybdopterin synthase catalytic subunit [Chryseobacterium daecheongense]
MKKIKNIFIEGPIDPAFVAESIAKHTVKTSIGGHSIFLGQVREDKINDKKVESIEFTAYQEMASEKAHEIREEIITKYGLTCAHIYHSLGNIKVGEICLFVFTSAPHRKEAINACDEMVDRIKKEVPLWGKEILEDKSHSWKENKQ